MGLIIIINNHFLENKKYIYKKGFSNYLDPISLKLATTLENCKPHIK